MRSLRAKFIRELTIRGRAERTIHAYVARLAALSNHYSLTLDRIGDEQIRDWLEHLRSGRKLSASSLNVTVNAVRAFQGRESPIRRRGLYIYPVSRIASAGGGRLRRPPSCKVNAHPSTVWQRWSPVSCRPRDSLFESDNANGSSRLG